MSAGTRVIALIIEPPFCSEPYGLLLQACAGLWNSNRKFASLEEASKGPGAWRIAFGQQWLFPGLNFKHRTST
jgi:hypothetical protein